MKIDIGQLNKTKLREFGLIIGAITALLFGLFLPWVLNHSMPLWPWIIAGILWAWAVLFPTILKPIYRVWMKIGHVFGWVNTRIILGIMFYIIFLPAGLVMKLMNKDPMARTIDKTLHSYRVINPAPNNKHIEKPF